MLNSTLRTSLFSAAVATACAFSTGCLGEQASQSDAEQALAQFGDSLAAGSALDRIGAQFDVLEPASLGVAAAALSADDTEQLIANAQAVGLRLHSASAEQAASWKPLADAALQRGLPLVLEGVESSDTMAALIGLGVEADLALVRAIGPNQYQVRVFGGNGLDESLHRTHEGALSSAEPADYDIDQAVEEVADALSEGPGYVASSTPATGYKYYDFDSAEESFTLTDGQVASLSTDFEAELVLDPARGKKNVFIRPIGPGQHPGSLRWNGNSRRGYYQESQQFTFTPNSASVSLYDHAPSTPNNNTTYTSSTGWTIGVSGQNPELSYSESNQESTTLSDFSVVNNTSGQVGSWKFYMTTNWTDMYKHPSFEKCQVKSIPGLAKSNLAPDFELLYRADDSFTSTVNFALSKVSVFRELKRGGDIFTCKKTTNVWTLTRGKSLSINFNEV